MRPTLSELGVYDGTALMEFKTKKNITYRINRESVCTYEMDDTPPFLINDDALDKALQIGLLFDCKLVDELHIARKQYLDGSIPTGFQRTAIYALDGKIPYKNRMINIVQMSIEEDSCREISDFGHDRVYRTDRLGMPLIETVTGPEMFTPQEVADVGLLCAKLVRSTGNVRRGMGAARQDVNVSVTGGTRVEIKGVPKLSMIPLLNYNEAMRQWNLLRLREELHSRGITEKTFKAFTKDVTHVLKKPHYLPLVKAMEDGMNVKCVVLKGYDGLLHWQTQTDTYFSREISDRVRVIACLTSIPNIVHSDSKGETITSAEWHALAKQTNAEKPDALVLVWGNEADTETAAKEIIIRAKEATIGIPSETRQALSDGTNGFERILPGADRMYPDTDLPPMRISSERVTRLSESLPEKFWESEKWYKKIGVPDDCIEALSISSFAGLFKYLVSELNIDPVLASVALIQYPKRIKKKGYDISKLEIMNVKKIFKLYNSGTIKRSAIFELIKLSIKHGKYFEQFIPKPIDEKKVIDLLNREFGKIKYFEGQDYKDLQSYLMGKVMRKYRYQVDGVEIADLVEVKLKEVIE